MKRPGLASKEAVGKMFSKPKVKFDEKEEGPPPAPPEPFISGISREGTLEMKFTEPMVVPKFKSNKRSLEEGISLSQIDVTRDILDFEFG